MPLVLLDPLVNQRGMTFSAKRKQEIMDRHAYSIFLVNLHVVVEIAIQLAGEVA